MTLVDVEHHCERGGLQVWCSRHVVANGHLEVALTDEVEARRMQRNISERDRAKDVEQLDDIFRNFINETNRYEGRSGKT